MNATTTPTAGPTSDATPPRDVETTLHGLFEEASESFYLVDDFTWFTQPGATLMDKLVGGLNFVFRGGLATYLRLIWLLDFKQKESTTTIYDARAREAAEGLSKADFFEKYGFVILDAKTAMTAADWEASERDLNAQPFKRDEDGSDERLERLLDDFRNGDTPVKRIHANEVEELVRSVIPRATRIMAPARGIRREVNGGGPKNKPAATVHNDYGLDFDEVVARNVFPYYDFGKQREIYDAANHDEFMLVNLWRPIAPMSQPLRSMPLCFLDSSTVGQEDIVTIDNQSVGLITKLKKNPNHRFYYYPDMKVDEVVLFKQFHKFRNESIARMPVFHTAFADPAADETTEGRISFELRVSLMV